MAEYVKGTSPGQCVGGPGLIPCDCPSSTVPGRECHVDWPSITPIHIPIPGPWPQPINPPDWSRIWVYLFPDYVKDIGSAGGLRA